MFCGCTNISPAPLLIENLIRNLWPSKIVGCQIPSAQSEWLMAVDCIKRHRFPIHVICGKVWLVNIQKTVSLKVLVSFSLTKPILRILVGLYKFWRDLLLNISKDTLILHQWIIFVCGLVVWNQSQWCMSPLQSWLFPIHTAVKLSFLSLMGCNIRQ